MQNFDKGSRELRLCEDLSKAIDSNLSRRSLLKAGGLCAFSTFLGACGILRGVGEDKALMGFEGITTSVEDKVRVPKGYSAKVLISRGDELKDGVNNFSSNNLKSESDLNSLFGDNNDGMEIFPISQDRALLAINNESASYETLFEHGGKSFSSQDLALAQSTVGVSFVEIKRKSDSWYYVRNSKLNRRLTALSPMKLTGAVRGSSLVKTSVDSKGEDVLGTFNNCATGKTPWGTFLTCEENFNNFFGSKDSSLELSEEQRLYGLKANEDYYHWFKFDDRFDIAKNPNEANRFGWVVEVDPFDSHSVAKKRTALGRFKHENAAFVLSESGHAVVYSGDDERGEFIYKFVSKTKYIKGNAEHNKNLLAEGRLYVARLKNKEGELKGKGEWVELSFAKNGIDKSSGFNNQAEVLIYARKAARVVGATRMDRPEWIAVHPDKSSVYCTLTNNKNRGKEGQPVDGANPRAKNKYGQVLRWWVKDGRHDLAEFEWDLFVVAGHPKLKEGLEAGSSNINEENMFNSPDGLAFDKFGRLWIQTDGNYSNKGDFEGMGNNQMLCANPNTGEIRRFMTGPLACEITGLAFSEDHKSMFVGIQHPGDNGYDSHFPNGGESTPLSSVVCIQKDDGGVIGT